jgi:hypothetical protein
MAVAQRGTGPFTGNGVFSLDRWGLSALGGDTLTVDQAQLTDANRASIGDEAASTSLYAVVAGTAAAPAYSGVSQATEDIRRLAGKTVTVSFYANSSVALKIGVNILQDFGTGGSPSANLWARTAGLAFTTAAGQAFSRFTGTIAVPSIVGKTLGTDGNDNAALSFFFSSGATNNSIAGNIGVQNGTFNIWGVQLEVGSVATPLEKLDPQQDFAKCQRFYQAGEMQLVGYNSLAGAAWANQFPLAVPMRATPTIVAGFATNTNAAATMSPVSNAYYQVLAVPPAVGEFNATGSFTASADI